MHKNKKTGFTLIETLVGVAIFVMIASSVYEAYSLLIKSARLSRLKIAATMIANEQIEIARNLPYSQVGTAGGVPSGVMIADRVIERDNAKFNVKATIRNIDDPFDGTLGGSPGDTAPADYKKVEVDVSCPGCGGGFTDLNLNTIVAPKNLETTSSNGALFINVYDALGQPIPSADVKVINSTVSPNINLTDITGNNGSLQLVDVPPSSQSYQVQVSKKGYSSEMTYAPNGTIKNPVKPNSTIAAQKVTQISFSIDKLSTINFSTLSSNCTPSPSVGFQLTGNKTLGTTPTVLKYNKYLTTDQSGNKNLSDIEWDTYNIAVPVTSTSTYYMTGSLPTSPTLTLPNSTQNFYIVTKPKLPNAILISVKDQGTKLPITGATVTWLKGTTASSTLVTGRTSQTQTDWSGGEGQDYVINQTKFYSSSNINFNNPIGDIHLSGALNNYESSGFLESSTFDIGSAGNFYSLIWNPKDQPSKTGSNSVKFQIATNNDKNTWNYLGPDGTSNSYYVVSGTNINALHNGNRYLRYKALLNTASTSTTPTISDVSFGFTGACVPVGQVFFDGLATGNYTLNISRNSYNSITNQAFSVTNGWQELIVYMTQK
ncbi:MAG: prepilin-type N-terminal cleavage/methylation domain-containing protein [bacterium]